MSKVVKGYKAMNKDLTCRKFKFKVGKTYESDSIYICSEGFHYCENLFDVYNYYEKSSDTVVCEIEALGEVQKEGDKSCTNKIKIIRQLTEKELLQVWIVRTNSGYGNSGYGNSGDWNSGDGNSGYFNTKVPLYFFNKPSDMVYTKEFENKIRNLNVKPILQWVSTNSMTEEEKIQNPSHKITEGFLRKTNRHDFRNLTKEDKAFIKSLPNFDNEVFKQITELDLEHDGKVKVIVNGVEKFIDESKAKELGLI